MNFKKLATTILLACLFLSIKQYAYSQNMLEEMKELHLQKTNGKITVQEFEAKKKAIIESHSPTNKRKAEAEARALAKKEEEEKKLQKQKNALLPMFKTLRTPSAGEINRAIELGADVNAVDEGELSVLMHAAAYCDDPEIIKLLVAKGADINARVRISILDDTYITVLTRADYNSNPEIKKLLIRLGALDLSQPPDLSSRQTLTRYVLQEVDAIYHESLEVLSARQWHRDGEGLVLRSKALLNKIDTSDLLIDSLPIQEFLWIYTIDFKNRDSGSSKDYFERISLLNNGYRKMVYRLKNG